MSKRLSVELPIAPVAIGHVYRERDAAIRVSELISALSYALDLTEGRPMGHSARTCLIGMRIAQAIGLPVEAQADLYYTLLLKDAGCSSNSSRLFHILNADEIKAKRDVKTTDWTKVGWDSLQYAMTHVATGSPLPQRIWTLLHVAVTQQKDSCELVKIRCERGSEIAKKLGFSNAVASGIHSLDEHWNGRGYPDGLRKTEIPLFSNIANLSQTLEVFYANYGPEKALEATTKRSGRWFNPELVRAAAKLSQTGVLFNGLDEQDLLEKVLATEPEHRQLTANEETIDNICFAFADVIDAKSPFTYRHSNGVADAALEIAEWFGMSDQQKRELRRAALLHDIGKLSVSNDILEKPGKLTNEEWQVVRNHPYYTYEILRRIPAFESISADAAAHHERLDGKGYWLGLTAAELPLPSRILAVADVFDALRAKRPYRDSLPLEKVFSIMREDAPHALDWPCLDALMASKSSSEFQVPGSPQAAIEAR
ncbi:MAG TPA: HD domain-containing phosphohydrolase [Candidatus Dormibacteraeota bacterium]|jgi:putative nucleotidyltransferase with HDIG domain|nr:HD domain-containing phosphohydrolase [Candidatus Dormibacteraeota bacterium]